MARFWAMGMSIRAFGLIGRRRPRQARHRIPLAPAVVFLALAPARAARAQATSAPSAAAATDVAPVEVTVRGTKPSQDIGSEPMPARNLRDVPGTFGDPFQAIASMPGVGPMASGLPYFYVRGAPPADTGFFLDGIPLPALFHIGPGPSVVPPALLDRVEFFPSTAPARFGRFVGGTISAETTPPSSVARGEASVRLFDASAFVESPLDARSTVVVAGRYGYPNLLLSLFAPHLSLAYGDYTLRLTRKLSDADSVSLLALGFYDDERDESQGLVPVNSVVYRLDLRYDHTWADGSLRVATTVGYDRTAAPLSTGTNEIGTETSDRVRVELRQRIGTARISAGADANALLDGVGSSGAHARSLQIAGAYVDAQYRPARLLEISAGARVDAYRSPGRIVPSVDPKLAVRVELGAHATWISTVGIAHQPPTYLLPVPGLRLDPSNELQVAYQYSEGVQVRLPWALKAVLTGFYSAERNMSDFVSDCGGFLLNCSSAVRVDGSAYGVEVLVERALSQRLGGWLSYTLSRAERHVGEVRFLSPFDRTHMLSAVLRYDFGHGIEAGLRATYNTGRSDIPTFPNSAQSLPLSFGTRQVLQHRLPAFYRIDLRAAKRWSVGSRAWLATVVEFFDATLNEEAVDFQCDVAQWRCTARKVGPIALPSIGLEGGF
jgi:hypothetical protein